MNFATSQQVFNADELDRLTVDEVKTHACLAVRQLDDALGRPPFPNPSSPCCRSMAQNLISLLNHLQRRGRVSALDKCEEINMIFPVLCASLRSGSEGRQPCPQLMELLLEGLCYVHGLSSYPLHSTLKDAKEVLPNSPLTLKLFALTGALDVDSMCFFFSLPQTACKTGNEKTKGRRNRTEKVKGTPKKEVPQGSGNGERETSSFLVPKVMIRAALDVVLPQDCVKLLLSLMNGVEKFQHVVGSDAELASRILGVYGDHLIPSLHPMALIPCLDVPVLDVFIDIVQTHGEKMSLLTELVFLENPLTTWAAERLERLLRYCVNRVVRNEDAFGSVLVYVFLYRVLAKWREDALSACSIELEARLWCAVVNASLIVPSTAEKTDRFVKPLSILSQCIRLRHKIDVVRELNLVESGILSPTHAMALLEKLLTLIDSQQTPAAAISCAQPSASGGKKRSEKGKTSQSHQQNCERAEDDICCRCGFILEALCLVIWLSPSSNGSMYEMIKKAIESIASLLLAVKNSFDGRARPPTATWECFLHALLSTLYIWVPCEGSVENRDGASVTAKLGHKSNTALIAAVQVTHKLQCCGLLALRLPESYTSQQFSLGVYKSLLNVWLGGVPLLENFYVVNGFPSPTQSIGLVLSFIGQEQMMELVCAVSEDELAASLLASAVERAIDEGELNDQLLLSAFLNMQRCLLSSMELRCRGREEQQRREEEAMRVQLFASVQRTEEILKKAAEFEENLRLRNESREREHAFIQNIREGRLREREERHTRERLLAQENMQKALMTLTEMNVKTKNAKEVEQKERLRLYRIHFGAISRMSSFLESLQLSSARVMTIMNTLRHYISTMTQDALLEYVVTGNREVPGDIHPTDGVGCTIGAKSANVERVPSCESVEDAEHATFGNEKPTFWESVMQLVKSTAEDVENTDDVDNKAKKQSSLTQVATADTALSNGASFHKRVTPILNLFDYSLKRNEVFPNPLPMVEVRTAMRVLPQDTLARTSFTSVYDALLACQERGLCVIRDGSCTLTPLGFRYHVPFHDPNAKLVLQLERRRCEAGAMVARRNMESQGNGECCDAENDSDEVNNKRDLYETDSDADASVVQFCDEII
ncbi:uncharacterized protein TEOVI_000099700 [Trypanosoma equiperdum]|uniref:Uncharacterized protein n=1 Tax=Trypanosoma equiperdum TaxID=5694 RepID=A0A1G4IBF9_TRYEQ|nr:hypothetical protein, conserved [Trypanosoma equiperdum]